jgi:hypothetical protein
MEHNFSLRCRLKDNNWIMSSPIGESFVPEIDDEVSSSPTLLSLVNRKMPNGRKGNERRREEEGDCKSKIYIPCFVCLITTLK